MKQIFLSMATVLSILIVTGCTESAEQAGAGAQQQPPTAVSVVTIKSTSVPDILSLPGRITPFRQSQVRPQVAGVITERLFEEGAVVEKGQQLYHIDDARYKAELASAKADLKSAEANLKTLKAKEKRYQDLLSRNSISEQEYDDVVAQSDQAEAQIAVAEAAIELAQVNVDYTKVYAPISGQISRSYVTVGTLVTANQSQELATITKLDPVFVDMQNSGKAIVELRRSMQGREEMPVEIILDEASNTKYEKQGMLKFSEVTVDETTGSVTLRAVMPNPDSVLMPGLFVKANVIKSNDQGLLVPQRATTRQQDGSLTVYVVGSNNTVEVRTIETPRSYKNQYLVTSGVSEGEQVIVAGYQKVKPGAKVTPQPWDQAQQGG
ncbi:efflux RND transporter periplasmic adaptor subunit [Salinimonas sediminis]|uniref:Efflux RND transporter periplasmic adaptor subunit n=1 Tax=Salinimonas sediminis TaxID=2303538 RepID=A0A346NRL8_9ALTE|nr:efflux RND transporter periplasmic adaptor subunit [Salinimonas sediminis]AXR08175.1 efflux RND transporter periplasmic adaptor subunit [Salinimonas sediminis]